MIPWLFIAALALLAIAITAVMAVIAVGHQTEERPGTIDLTGIQPRAGYDGPSASRVRAEAERPLVAAVFGDSPATVRVLREARFSGLEVYVAASGVLVTAQPGTFRDVPDGFERLSEHELAARIAMAGGVHETGGQAA